MRLEFIRLGMKLAPRNPWQFGTIGHNEQGAVVIALAEIVISPVLTDR
jgi:hypothetical protein